METGTVRCCRACGSTLCSRDDECPTCSTCGKRGHLTCTAPSRLEESDGPQVEVGVGVDRQAGMVVLQLKIGDNPAAQVHLTDAEVGELCMALVKAAQTLRPVQRPAAFMVPGNKPAGQKIVLPPSTLGLRPRKS